MTCAAFHDLAPELALGLLDGEERAAALAHAAGCDACQHELTALGSVADDLVALTPAMEPPPGFESKVIGALRPEWTSGRGHRRKGRARRVWVLAAAAAVAVAAALGGWALSLGSDTNTGPQYAAGAVSAPLMAGGHEMGDVMLADGTRPWLSMAVISNLGDTTVTCQVHERDGRVVTVGSFGLVGGKGYWAAALPVSLQAVTTAQLLAADGATIATAHLSS